MEIMGIIDEGLVILIVLAAALLSGSLLLYKYYRLLREGSLELKGLSYRLRELENLIKDLQGKLSRAKREQQELSTLFVFLPELISKLTSYNESSDKIS